MTMVRRLVPLIAVCGLALVATSVSGAARVASPGFGPMITLTNNSTQRVGVGGEPSLQDDGQGHVYVTSPVGIDTAAINKLGVITFNEATGGGALWRSLDGGASFANPTTPIFFGTPQGGGDTDVTADSSGTLYTADLEAVATDIQHSLDYGSTFSQPAQNGPDNDREWLTPVGKKVYLTYHDFAANVDLIYVSNDGGTTFVPSGTGKIISPTDTAAAADCADGNLLSKPVTDSSGGIYILINCSTFPSQLNPLSAPLDRLYIAISRDGGTTFTTKLVSDVSNGGTNAGSYGKVFNQLGIDARGNLYVVASGNLHSGDPVQTFLIRSLDNGVNWKAPINLNTATNATDTNASVFPAIATGQAGQVAAGYYRVVSCDTTINPTCSMSDYRNDGVTFQYFITQTLNALATTPTFVTTQVTTTSPHHNGICTDGVFCGTSAPFTAGGNRNLADFESMAVDPTGHIELVIPADPDNVKPTDTGGKTVNWYFKQTSGPLMVPGATNGNGTGNQTYVTTTSPPSVMPEFPLAAGAVLAGAAVALGVGARSRRRRAGAAAA